MDLGVFDEAAERIHELHLVDRLAARIKQPRRADQIREALRAA